MPEESDTRGEIRDLVNGKTHAEGVKFQCRGGGTLAPNLGKLLPTRVDNTGLEGSVASPGMRQLYGYL